MFRKTEITRQLNLQTSVSQHLVGLSYDIYADDDSWHNVFYKQVVTNIDEKIILLWPFVHTAWTL